MAELLLDPSIRMWVILPIVVITVLFGLLRHYIMVLLRSDNDTVTKEQIKDGQALMRSRLLRENGGCISKESFLMRKAFFDDEEEGYFKKETRPNTAALAMGDPNMAFEMMKGTLTNVLPMILVGGWINMTFSGFITTKVPFPLTLRFKTMLQRGIELQSLNSSWVSSASWYFLNVFGLRSIYGLILGADNAADHTGQMVQQMSMQGGGGMGGAQQPNMNQLFKEEWEALQVVQHTDTLADMEEELVLVKDTSDLSLSDPRLKKLN